MIKLCPGWVCQPLLPPGCQVLLCTYRSDGPLVFCKDIQTLPGKPEGRSLLDNSFKTSNSSKVIEGYIGVGRETEFRFGIGPIVPNSSASRN